jgi:hypothetical protein
MENNFLEEIKCYPNKVPLKTTSLGGNGLTFLGEKGTK